MTQLVINGNVEYVSDDITDFSELVRKYMGDDSQKYFDEFVNEFVSVSDELEYYLSQEYGTEDDYGEE